MKSEADFCTIVKNSLVVGFKIPDPGYGNFTNTVIRCFDGIGMLENYDKTLDFVCWEAKYMKQMQAFSFSRIEPHQAYYLSQYSKAKNIRTYILLGLDLGRTDKRAYIFEWRDIADLFDVQFSIHKEFLEDMPYNEIKNGVFRFDNIITRETLNRIYGDIETAKSMFKDKLASKEEKNE